MNLFLIRKISEVKNEIPSITGLATTSALAAVENKIPSINNLVMKTNYDTKISEIEKKLTDHNHDKYITIPEFNKLKLTQVDLVKKKQILIISYQVLIRHSHTKRILKTEYI